VGILKKILTAFLLTAFAVSNAVSYSYIAVSMGHVGVMHHEDCDTCKKINSAIANLTHSVTILTPETAIPIKEELAAHYVNTISDQHIIWVHTLIASKVQLNC
jgi:hypothetical protein